MNNMLTVNHHLANMGANIANVSKVVVGLEKQARESEDKYSTLYSVVTRIQDRLMDLEADRSSGSQSTSSVSEEAVKQMVAKAVESTLKSYVDDKIKPIVKEHVAASLANILATPASLDGDQAFSSIEDLETAVTHPGVDSSDDIIIEEKPKKNGKKGKKNAGST